MIEIQDVRRLDVKPGDRLLVTVPARSPQTYLQAIVAAFTAAFPDAKVVIMPDTVTATVVEFGHTDAALIQALDRADRIRGRHHTAVL